jgi:murein L,D-transpeptidase YcbB/YkuD
MVYVRAGPAQQIFLMSLSVRVVFAALLLVTGLARADPASEALRERVEQLRAGRELRVDGEQIAARALIARFYEQRDFRPAWTPARAQALLALVEGSRADGLDPRDYHLAALRAGKEDPADRELLYTDSLIRLAYSLYFGKLDPRSFDPQWNYARTLDGIDPPRALEALVTAPSLGEALYAYAPQLPEYRGLRQALVHYRALRDAGGWQPLPPGPTLRPGMRDARVAALRARLAVAGDLASADAADLEQYDPALEAAVTSFQDRHGLEPDGIVGRRTLAALNVGVQARIDQIRVNLERLRWVAQDLQGDYLLVDIAGFRARLVLDGKTAWTSRVVVGRPYRKTPVFRATMRYIVLNPTWNVPPTILDEDILPKLARDPGMLARDHMKVLDRAGNEVDPATVDWAQYAGRTPPYRIVQAPGDGNPLGRLKFMFPNGHDVYLHDTPARELFHKSERAFSSGCIRVQHPLALALLLLDDPQRWSVQTLAEAIGTGETRSIFVKRKVPVMLLYWTAVADENGTVEFHADLYGRDAPVLKGLEAPFRLDPGLKLQ